MLTAKQNYTVYIDISGFIVISQMKTTRVLKNECIKSEGENEYTVLGMCLT